MKYKVLIIDDEPLVQIGVRSMIDCSSLQLEICGMAANGQNGLEMINELKPHIVITDIKMPIMSGLEMIKKCRELHGNNLPAFILLTGYEDFKLAKEALSYQVTDYLVKLELTSEELNESIKRAIDKIKNYIQDDIASTDSVSSEKRDLEEHFYIRLLNNLFESEEQYEHLKKELGITFDCSRYQCCYVDFNVNAKPENEFTLYTNAFRMLNELVKKYTHSFCVRLDVKHNALILFLNDGVPDNFAIKILSEIRETLYNYYGISIYCGIGSIVSSQSSIYSSFQSSRLAYNSCTKDNAICFIGDCFNTESKDRIFNMSIFRDDLQKAYSEYDADLLRGIFNEIISLFSEHTNYFVQCLDAACGLLYLSISLIPDGDKVINQLFEEESDGYRSIYKLTSTTSVIEWMKKLRDKLCTYFSDRKKEHRHHTVENVKAYIKSHISERLNLNDVSAIFDISPNYLSSLFKKYSELGYSEYVTYCKIEESKKLLSSTNMRVYEVADALGFESSFYFSKVFKKVAGISPTDYQNKICETSEIK